MANPKIDTQPHPFDEAIRLAVTPEGYVGRTPENYANMIGPFGGVMAATILKAAMDHPKRQGDPLALTVNYAAPITNGDFAIKATPLRTNRSTQHWSMLLSQQGQVGVSATAVFASRRATWSATEVQFPSVPDAKDVKPIPVEMYPAWVRNYDIRTVRGDVMVLTGSPVEEADDSVSIQWIKDNPSRALDFLSLAAISDVFVPRILVRRNRLTGVGTVSLSIYFHANAESLTAQGDKAVLGQARALRFYNSYSDQVAEVWSSAGELLATSSQVVYFKD